MKRLRWMATAVIVFLALAGCERQAPADSTQAPSSSPQSSSASTTRPASAPLARIDLQGLQEQIDQARKAGQVLVLDFWATWCPPCVVMFPALHEEINALGPTARILSITLDGPGKDEAAAVSFLEKHHALDDAYLLVPDTDERLRVVSGLGQQWQELVVPAILIFGPDGQLAAEFIRGEETPMIVARVREVLSLDSRASSHASDE